MTDLVRHTTASVFLFTRWGRSWRLCVVEHPRLGGHLVAGGHGEGAEGPVETALREVEEETGYRARLLPPPLPNGYPHAGIPAAWHVVDMPAAPDSKAHGRHVHRDHIFVGVVDRPFAPAGPAEHTTRWVPQEDLRQLELPDDTRVLGRHLFDRIEQAVAEQRPVELNGALRDELLRRQEQDQEVRLVPAAARTPQLLERWKAVDEENTKWLKEMIASHGWPGEALAGRDGASAAWLLAQHADRDGEFQQNCLRYLAASVTSGDADPRHGALLEDRVLVGQGMPQVFGTQLTQGPNGQELVPFPLRDPQMVDELREAWGFDPLSVYLRQVAQTVT